MIDTLIQSLNDIHPALVPVAGLLGLVLIAWVADMLVKYQLMRIVKDIAQRSQATWDDLIIEHRVVQRGVQLLPAILVYLGLPWLPGLPDEVAMVLRNATLACMAIIVVLTVSALLNAASAIYESAADARRRPIKGYVQVAKIVLFILGGVLVVAALLDKSPLLLLSGFGALTAILLLVFKDTILSLVASVQLTSQDMVHVGDWIEMPQFNADGDVIDVALHTVRVQNWDKTITTIPTHRLISDSFRNWRGMSESGGRRIKRALAIDMRSVRFLTPEEAGRFRRFVLLDDYVQRKEEELRAYNDGLDRTTDSEVNLRRLTNLGTFRAYVYNYLKHHPAIRDDMTLLVRQLAPTPSGIPIEVYCFTATTEWNAFEGIQADIFDHLLAILTEFGLRPFQQPGGADLDALSKNGQVSA